MLVRVNRLLGHWTILSLLLTPVARGGDTRLVEAVKDQQDIAAIRALLKQHADVNAPLPDGATALHWAAYRDDTALVELLLKAGAGVNVAAQDGALPLYLACVNRNAAIVEKLLTAGADPNAALPSGESPLMTAARTDSVPIVRLLLAHGAKLNAKGPHGQTALMWAVASEHADVTKALLDADAATSVRSDARHRTVNTGIAIAERDKGINTEIDLGGFTPMLFAARNGNVELGKMLLASGANVNDVAPSGQSALALSAHAGNGAFAMFLLEHGADPNAADGGFAPLHAAVLRGDRALVEALLAKGANPNAELTKGTGIRYSSHDFHINGAYIGATPYWLAAQYAEPEIMRILAEHGADTKRPAADGTSPLIAALGGNAALGTANDLIDRRGRMLTPTEKAAIPEGEDERISLLVAKAALDLGADPNQPDKSANTALAEAVNHGYESVVKLLLDNGANIKVATKSGDTPLHLAAQGGYEGVIRLLVAWGADLDAKDQKGLTPLAMASAKSNDPYAAASVTVVQADRRKAAANLLIQLGAHE